MRLLTTSSDNNNLETEVTEDDEDEEEDEGDGDNPETGSLVAVQLVLSSNGVLLALFSRLMNTTFSVLFPVFLTFYLHSAYRMPKELEIGVLLAFS